MEKPQLQPPGAGLPLPQKLAIRLIIGPFVSRWTPRAKSQERYEILTQKIIETVSAVPLEKRRIPFLVNPIVGLEDSSRYWSLNELMEHLLIVTRNIESFIMTLSSGQVPNVKVDLANVKPKSHDQDFLDEFKSYAPGVFQTLNEKISKPEMNFNSSLKFRHPWFGDLTARQWYWILGSHQGIHFRQAREIAMGVTKN